MDRARVLMVELLSRDRFRQFRSALYPFLSGLGSRLGAAVRWICVGFDPDTQLGELRALTLPHEDLERVGAAVRTHRATRLVLNEHLGPGQEQELLASCPGADLLHATRAGFDTTCVEAVAWLGLAPHALATTDPPLDPDGLLVESADPDYRHELANAAARQAQPLTKIVSGPACVYHRSLAGSPDFDGIDLSGLSSPDGCSFCRHPGPSSPRFRTSAAEVAARQVLAVSRLPPTPRFPPDYEIGSVLVLHQARRFFDRILDARLPPSAFYFGCRIDELLQQAGLLSELLPRLHEAGHTIHLANVGVENFSPRENARLNKHIGAEQVQRFLATLDRWDRRWPETVHFDRHGGFGFILFTPWTTLDDLEINARWLRELAIRNVPFCLASRLLLSPERPIVRLARRDDLTCDRFEDPLMARFCLAGCLTEWEEQETPWRFAHPEVALLYRVLLRLHPGIAEPLRDADWERIATAVGALAPEQRDPLCCLDTLLEVVRSHPETRTVSALCALWEQRSTRPGRPAVAPPPSWTRPVREAAVAMGNRLGEPVRFESRTRSLWITFGSDPPLLTVIVTPSAETERAYLRQGELALSYASDTPLDSAAKVDALVQLARLLDPRTVCS